MRHTLAGAALLLLLAGAACAQSGPPETSAGKPLFTFRSSFWVNLHHFLYVLGRAKNGTADSQRKAVVGAPAEVSEVGSPREREIWERAMARYQREVSPMDAVFDHDLIAITNALAAAGDAPSLDAAAIPATLSATLEEAAPVYRKLWWERHSRANRARIAEVETLLARYGRPLSEMLTKVYQQPWPPEGLTVQMCAYANWAGAYSTSGRLIVMASEDEAVSGSEGLETIFHEAMHQWDDAIIPKLRDTARRLHADFPPKLSHSLIFYTAGYATAQVVPGHRPYADALWTRALPGKPELDAYWLPYLRGEGTFQAALDRLIGSFAK